MEIGEKLPEFLGLDQDGNEVKLSDFQGKKLVLYIYPRDATPGCTNEACNLRDNYQTMLDKGYAVVGVSIQSLIADTDKKLVEALGAYGEKKMYGKTTMGTFRTTFVTDENGVITEIFRPKQIKVKEHAQQILGAEA